MNMIDKLKSNTNKDDQVIKIAPSILSADMVKLNDQIKTVEQAGAHLIHIDVMDGHFVPNLTFGPLMVEAVRRITDLPLDVHLMIENPGTYIKDYIDAGANILTIHQEASTHLHRDIAQIKQLGAMAGVSLNPSTSEQTLEYVIDVLDLVLVMSVNPGFGGQKFIPAVLKKFSWLKEQRNDLLLEIDGGIDPQTAKLAVNAGANVLVAGNAVFGKSDVGSAVKELINSVNSLTA